MSNDYRWSCRSWLARLVYVGEWLQVVLEVNEVLLSFKGTESVTVDVRRS